MHAGCDNGSCCWQCPGLAALRHWEGTSRLRPLLFPASLVPKRKACGACQLRLPWLWTPAALHVTALAGRCVLPGRPTRDILFNNVLLDNMTMLKVGPCPLQRCCCCFRSPGYATAWCSPSCGASCLACRGASSFGMRSRCATQLLSTEKSVASHQKFCPLSPTIATRGAVSSLSHTPLHRGVRHKYATHLPK